MENIIKTKDYNLFKLLRGNRPVNKAHLKKVTESIKNNNQLNLHPIIVNSQFEIIDGQHRYMAAKNLNTEIFYIQSDTITDEHLIECNVNQKSFEVENYIDYFALKQGSPAYVKLKNMLADTKLKPKALLTLVIGVVSTSLLSFLKTGKFKFPESENVESILGLYKNFMTYAEDKRLKPRSMFTNHNFTRAFRWLHHTNGFNPEILFKKLDLRWFDLKPQRTSEDWYALLISIYNFKNHNRLEDDYIR